MVLRITLLTSIIFLSICSFTNREKWDIDKSDWTSLMMACYKGKVKKVKRLIQKEAEVNYSSKKGISATIIAIRKQDTSILKLLIDSGKLDANNSGNLVMLASMYESSRIVEVLVGGGFPIKNDQKYTPLMASICHGSLDIVKYLIKRKNDIDAQNSNGWTALMFAAYDNDIEKVKVLISAGADKKIKNDSGKTVFDYVKESKTSELIQLLKF